MASYQEVFTSKLDWAMPFQRTGKFPLDRSSIFDSYADALAYAKQDGSDKRSLGGSSYIGQIIAVYGNDAGASNGNGEVIYSQEVAAYIITGVGESAALMRLAQTTATGDFASDIQALQTALSTLEIRVKALEDKPDVVDTNTEYEFTTAITTNGAIRVYNKADKTEQEVQVKGWAELQALASGRNKSYVYTNTEDTNFITAASKTGSFKVGDVIYFTDINIPDYWVGAVLTESNSDGQYYSFYNLETTKVDLTGYQKEADADIKYATKAEVNSKASQSDLNSLSQTVTNNASANTTAHQELQEAINKVEEDLSKIDVSSQIISKINDLDVAVVGGAEGSYIKSIKQVDGKIEATAATLPDYDTNAQNKADKALSDAKDYVDSIVGEIGESETVKSYVDTTVQNHQNVANQVIESISSRVKIIEDAKYGDEISSLKQSATTHTNEISGLTSRVTATEAVANKAAQDISTLNTIVNSNSTALENHATAIENLQTNVASRVKEIQLGGVKQTMTSDGVVNITSISTDLLSQGKNTLVLDCLNAALTDNQ